jgi:YD repeat-containing protein
MTSLARLRGMRAMLLAVVGLHAGGAAWADELTLAEWQQHEQMLRLQRVEITGVRPIGDPKYTSVDWGIQYTPPPSGLHESGSGGGGASGANQSEPVKPDPPSQNNSKENCGEVTEHPVLLSTGEKVLPQVDAQLANIYGFAVERNYRSQNTGGTAFGPNWLSSLDGPRVSWSGWVCDSENVCAPQYASLTLPNGARYWFQQSNGIIGLYRATESASMGALQYTNPGRTWKWSHNHLTYNFSSTGALDTIKTSAGTPIRSNFYTSGRLSSFTIGTGSAFSVTWTNGLVTEVKDPSLKIWRYGYDTNGMLTTVTSPGAGSEIDTRTYHYENTADPTLLTGMSINDVRYSTYAYYTDKRVKESGLSDGQEKDTIAYSGNTTTVTDARGEKTTYTFTDVLGELRATSISRAATTTCAAAAAKTFYDANGYPDYTLDWNNNKTDYTYASDGLLSSVTTAAGTSSALTRGYTWSGTDLKQILFKGSNGVAYKQVDYTYYATGLASGRIATETWTDLRLGGTRKLTHDYIFHTNNGLDTEKVTEQLVGTATNITTTAYDIIGNTIAITNGAGHVVRWAGHNGLGLPGTMTDVNAIVTTYTYLDNGNLRSTSQAVSATAKRYTPIAHNHNRQVTGIIWPNGRYDKYTYNTASRLYQVGDRDGNYVQRDFNVATNTETVYSTRYLPSWSATGPTGTANSTFLATTVYDSLGRPYDVNGNNGQKVSYRYDGNGNVLTRTDVALRVTRCTYDAQNRVSTVTAPDTQGCSTL